MALFQKKKTQDESYYLASQWQLMWRKLQKHKLAKFSLVLLIILYIGALLFSATVNYISCSQAITVEMRVNQELRRRGVNSHAVAMDNYFLTVNPKTAPRTPEGDIDYESPLCMDMDLLDEHFTALSAGEEILIPKFEFARQMRSAVRSKPLQLGNDEIAIFEGIHALNDIFAGKNPNAMKVYIPARSNVLDEEGNPRERAL